MNFNLLNAFLTALLITIIISEIVGIIKRIKNGGDDYVEQILPHWLNVIGGIVITVIVILVVSAPLLKSIIKIGGVFVHSEAEATVVSVGYQGIVVEFYDMYGKEKYEDEIIIPNNEVKAYRNGDKIKIYIADSIFFNHPEAKAIFKREDRK